MKTNILNLLTLGLTLAALNFARADETELIVSGHTEIFGQKPIPVSLEGFTGEVAEVLKFDLYVQGFKFVAPEAAQYRITSSGAVGVAGYVTDTVSRQVKFSHKYDGASVRRLAHKFADDIVAGGVVRRCPRPRVNHLDDLTIIRCGNAAVTRYFNFRLGG